MLTDVKDSLGTPRDKEMLLKVLMGWGGSTSYNLRTQRQERGWSLINASVNNHI